MWNALSFSSPWLLAAAILLPALWWLLRLIPPPPRLHDFPAVRLLFGLHAPNQAAQTAPWWLILLRLSLVSLLILAASGPHWQPDRISQSSPLLLVIDNGWAAGKLWTSRREISLALIGQAERAGQPVALLACAPPADGGAIALIGPLAAGDARSLALDLQPQPWQDDRAGAALALKRLPHGTSFRVVWLSDGLDEAAPDAAAALAAQLQTYGRLEMSLPALAQLAQQLPPPANTGNRTILMLQRPGGGPAGHSTVRSLDQQGRTLALTDLLWADGARDTKIAVAWPNELQTRMARLVVDAEQTAAATVLLDGSWSRHAVGLVDDGGASRIPLLDDLFYGERALAGFAEARRGSIDTLLQRPLSLLVLPDRGALAESDHARLQGWVEQGGTLVRFAGPDLAGNPDDLLPVRLRRSERLLGGALSWAQPMAVAPMPEQGPFAGLQVPPDLTVSAQILAEPDLALPDKVWAKLVDGTPLVTGAPLGKGWLVLIHTTAWPGWSNLALSGLFPDMLHRLLDRSSGVASATAERPLPALQQLDGFGRLSAPQAATEAWPAGDQKVLPGPHHPPGLYGDSSLKRAVNLTPLLPEEHLLMLPSGAQALDTNLTLGELPLTAALLLLVLLLLLADLALLTGMRRRAVTAIVVAGLGWSAGAADDAAAALDSRLAYVITGDAQIDETSRAGLAALSRQVIRRTTAQLAEPDGIDLDHDQLAVYPLLYWPLTATQRPLSGAAQARLNDFMRHGGLLVIDSRDGGTSDPERLRKLTSGIDIPPLMAVGDQHVLAKSFYLLHDFPGRLDGAPLFAERDADAAHDFVSKLLIGGKDWAAAWALDRQGATMCAVVPGGETQREMAFRTGVNLVIYALTGSYKADQVHLPAILERMHR